MAATICSLTASAQAQDAPAQVTPVSATPKLPLWVAGLFGTGYIQPAYPGADDCASRFAGITAGLQASASHGAWRTRSKAQTTDRPGMTPFCANEPLIKFVTPAKAVVQSIESTGFRAPPE